MNRRLPARGHRTGPLGVPGPLVLGLSIVAAHLPAQQTPAATTLALRGVTVVDVTDGRLIPDQTVIVAGPRIQAMGAADKTNVPKDAQIVEAKGKYLIPGLWDLHVHPRRLARLFYPLFIANGVTGIRDAGSEVPIDTLQLWRREILAGTRVGPPRQLLSGQSIAGPQEGCQRAGTTDSPQTCVTDGADARRFVDSLKAAGADMVKPRAVSRELYFAIAAEARRQKIPFGGHAQEETAIEVADSGGVTVDHMQHALGDRGLGVICWGASATVESCKPTADRLTQAGTWFVPTLMREGGAGGKYAEAVAQLFTKRAGEFWGGTALAGNWLRESTGGAGTSNPAAPADGAMRIMQQVGLPIVAGTDAGAPVITEMPPGFALHVELAMYVTEGLTPLNALQSATINPAKLLHATDSLGTVAPGKLADLVLLDANPLTDITNTTTINAVVANGRYFDRAALDRLLADVRSADRSSP